MYIEIVTIYQIYTKTLTTTCFLDFSNMSIVRDIPIISQHSAEPNPAVMQGFGSVAPSAPTNLGGLDGSICSTQYREESRVCDQPPIISLYGSLNKSRGLEQAGGGYGEDRGRARKLYDATSVVDEPAACLERRDTYQLGRKAQSDVTSQAQTAWQEKADAAEAANFGHNETDNHQQGFNEDMKGRKFSNFFPGKTHSEKIKIFKSTTLHMLQKLEREIAEETGSCESINQNYGIDKCIEQEDLSKKEYRMGNDSKLFLNLDIGTDNVSGFETENKIMENFYLHYDDLNIVGQPIEFQNSEMDFLAHIDGNNHSPKYLQDVQNDARMKEAVKSFDYDPQQDSRMKEAVRFFGYDPSLTNDHDLKRPDLGRSSPIVNDHDNFQFDQPKITSEDLQGNSPTFNTSDPLSLDEQKTQNSTMNIVSNSNFDKSCSTEASAGSSYSKEREMDILGEPMETPNPISFDVDMYDSFSFDYDAWNTVSEVKENLDRNYSLPCPNLGYPANNDEILNEMFAMVFDEEMAKQQEQGSPINADILSIHDENEKTNVTSCKEPDEVLYVKQNENFSSTQKEPSFGNPISTQPSCSGQHLVQENPHRTRSTAVDTTQTPYNEQFLPSFFQIIEAPGAQEVPNAKDFLKRKELTHCPGTPGKSCTFYHKDVIQLLRHYSYHHYDSPQNRKLHPSSPHFCHTCSDTFLDNATWKRHLITMAHLSRTFIAMFLQNSTKTQNMYNKEHDTYSDRLTFLESRELDKTPNNLIEVLTAFILCIHYKAREYFKTSTTIPTIKEFGSIRSNIMGYIKLSNTDYTSLPNTTLKRKGADNNGPLGYIGSGEGTVILTIDCSVNTVDKESEEAERLYKKLLQIIKTGQDSDPNHEIYNGIQGHSYIARCRKGYKRNTPCLDLQYNTNSKMELENIKMFFNILYKHVKTSKLSIAKKMSGKLRFVNRRDESDKREFIPQVDGGNSPPPDSDFSDEHEEDTINNSDGIDTINTIFETGYDSEKSFTTGATIQSDPKLDVRVQVHKDLGEMMEGSANQKIALGDLNRRTHTRKSSIQSNIVINTLTIQDFQKIETQIDPDSLKRFTTLKEKYENRRTAFELSNSQLNMYRTMAGNPDMIPIINNAESITEKLKDDMSDLEKNLHSLTNKKNNVEFIEPTYGTKSTYLPTILGIIQTLAPGTNRRVKTTWNYIANIITTKGLNKEAGRNILGAIVKGEMVDVFELYSHLCGREIAIKLSDIFDTPLDKAKYLDDLQKFQKKDDENFGRAIARLHSILIGIETHKRPGERTTDKDIQMRHHLRQMTGDKIYFEVLKEERSNAQEGRILTIEQLAKRCDLKYLEALERKRPDLTINLHTLSMGENAPLRNAGKFVERENREHNTRQRARNNQNQLFDSSIDKDLLEATEEQTDSMEWEAQEGPKEQNRKQPLVATRKLINNNTDKNHENNSEKRNTDDNSHHQDKTTRDQKRSGSYSNVKQTSWTGNKGSTNAQQLNYSYDNDRKINSQQQGNRNNTDKPQNQPSTNTNNQYQGQSNYRGDGRQRFSSNQGQSRYTAPTYNQQNQYGQSNWRGGYNEKYGYSRGYRQGPGRREVVRYIASPQILYDQLCPNEGCHTPQTQVHHRLECPKLKERGQNNQHSQQQPQNQQQGF